MPVSCPRTLFLSRLPPACVELQQRSVRGMQAHIMLNFNSAQLPQLGMYVPSAFNLQARHMYSRAEVRGLFTVTLCTYLPSAFVCQPARQSQAPKCQNSQVPTSLPCTLSHLPAPARLSYSLIEREKYLSLERERSIYVGTSLSRAR